LYYHLTTFGCQMNEHDSERIRGVLEEHGWTPADRPEDADLLVYNTCAVRESAESRLLGRLGEAKRLKRNKPGRLVALGGCFAQSRRDLIFSELPFLDVAFGPQNIGELPALLESAAQGPAPAYAFDDFPAPSADLPTRRLDQHRAWVQAMSGCTNYCSYCIVPHVRGPEYSRAPEDIVEEVRQLAADGVVEITVLGQNVNAYGNDRGSGESDFADLLKMLDGVEGIKRIRFTTSHPKDLSDSLIEAIRDLPSVCEHLHLPAQSGSTRILKRMKRGYSREEYIVLVEGLRQSVPDIALTTDLIVGFPGEREEDFYRTMTLVERCSFDGAFTFRFSPRPETEAAGYPGRVPEGTTARRMDELVSAIQRQAAAKNKQLENSVAEVLVEGPSKLGGSQFKGRTRTNKIVNFDASTAPEEGTLVKVMVDDTTSTTLKGHMAVS
jgi:tRNA-2-methylthio-N6-dimethylallyladenosine synthase